MDADGSHARRLLAEPFVAFPAWSPDGGRIAFDMKVDGVSHIGILDLRTGEIADIGPGTMARWSADGQRLLVTTPDYARIQVVTIADGSRTTLTRGSVGIWSPDGASMVFTRSAP